MTTSNKPEGKEPESEATREEQKNEDDDENAPRGSIFQCFRFAKPKDYLIFSLGVMFALLTGTAFAFLGLIGGLAFGYYDTRYTRDEIAENVQKVPIYFLILGICSFVGMLGSRTLLRFNAQRQGYRIRKAYLTALLQRPVHFFDKVNPMEFSSQIENDCATIVNSLDLQIESLVSTIGVLIASIIMSFARSWVFTLIALASTPFLAGATVLYHTLVTGAAMQRSKAYAKAGAIAEETLMNIRTVASLGGERAEVDRYNEAVSETQKKLAKTGVLQGLAFGLNEFVFFTFGAICFYVGSIFIEEGRLNDETGIFYTAADVFIPWFAIHSAFAKLPVTAMSLKGVLTAGTKMRKISKIIDQFQADKATKTIPDLKGSIKFNNVTFAYPSAPTKTILQGLTLEVKPNTKVAFVGESGCGKSTLIQLIQKFYDPLEGSVEIDGEDLKGLDMRWLRKNVAYVGQEPVLFSMTIKENLLLAKEDATEDELVGALKQANAYDFVMDLENKLDTYVGGGGVGPQLSGGQKQRIAIARALLKNPKILLLDEATSALDRISEKEIQATLDTLLAERTVVIVAHRLSTIQEADQIIVLDQGKVVEIGTHEELISKGGKYFELEAAQAGIATDVKPNEVPSPPIQRHVRERSGEFIKMKSDREEESPLLPEMHLLSQKSSAISEEEQAKEKNRVSFAKFRKLWSLARSERKYFYLGFLGVFGNSLLTPIQNTVVCGTVGFLLDSAAPDFRSLVNFGCISFIVTGVLYLLCYTLGIGFFVKGTETFVQTLRSEIFYKFLRMEMAWHDHPQHTPGNMVTSLENDTGNVGQLTGTSIGIITQIILSNLFMLIVVYILTWQLALVGTILVPLIILVAIKLNTNEAVGEEKCGIIMKEAEVVTSETINNMKTIVSLNAIHIFLRKYDGFIKKYQAEKFHTRMFNGLLEGGMQFILYADLAATYYLGSYLYFTQDLDPVRIFLAVFGMGLTALFSADLFVIIPDTGKAAHSINVVLRYLKMKSNIDIEDTRVCYRGDIKGSIEFKNVHFTYPTRNQKILSDVSFTIPSGRQIGIAGPSGCGKSTIIQLLLRFYDVDAGEIFIDGVNIQEYDLKYLRKKIAVVFQEPVLFYGSIEYNLKYGLKNVSNLEMVEAAQRANALRFIEAGATSEQEENEEADRVTPTRSAISLEGFNRIVGAKGGQLSGGQKQRLAIARALLRKPKILLLDEATSALDTRSEGVVQNALNKASQGLTTVAIAHRLSTIQDADEILVLKEGQIIEQGKFEALLEKKGYFYDLKEGAQS